MQLTCLAGQYAVHGRLSAHPAQRLAVLLGGSVLKADNPQYVCTPTWLLSTTAHCLQARRFPAWEATLQYVQQHRGANELHSWTAGLTEWADWTDDEFRAAFLGQVTYSLRLESFGLPMPP